MIKKILLVLLVVLVIMQFFRIDTTNPAYPAEQDFLTVENVDHEVGQIIKHACYDCHSFETIYPWYSNFAPASWIIKDHIDEGREEMNFSEWSTYKEKRKKHKFEECYELVSEGEMPLKGYAIMHSKANLSDDQRKLLVEWFKNASKH